MFKRLFRSIKKHPILAQLFISFGIGIAAAFLFNIELILDFISRPDYWNDQYFFSEILPNTIFAIIIVGGCLVLPLAITIYNFFMIFAAYKSNTETKASVSEKIYDFFTITLALLYYVLYIFLLSNIKWVDWSTQIYVQELHSPINLAYMPSLIGIFGVSMVSMAVLHFVPNKKRSPLVTVLSIGGLYMGLIIIGIAALQFIPKADPTLIFTLAIPFNLFMIDAKIIIREIKTYNPDENRMSRIESNSFLSKANSLLLNSKNWPLLAIFFMIPLLGLLIAILALFGQAPDAAIKAFTETADFTFSTKIPPQSLPYDGHYLCTVAAGGHEKIVKPLRMGKRHGHAVIVNRQLCVANAFEQILEEKTPRLHKCVRDFYDKHGLPIAKLIKSKWIADLVWFIMKPLEWFFLIVLYLVDVHPEDRIARQYTK